jgi:beta-galactosidase
MMNSIRIVVGILVLLLSARLSAAKVVQQFPEGFLWGVAISGFQNDMGQGAPNDENSDWWVWARDPDNIATGKVSGDLPEDGPGFYNFYGKAARQARRLGANAFRMSIEWSRIFPTSTAAVDISGGFTPAVLAELDALADQDEVAHYRAVFTELRKRRLEPMVTLTHFTLPLWLHDPIAVRDAFASVNPFTGPVPPGLTQSGWLDAAIVDEFAKYAAYAGFAFGDLVDSWAPINEPIVVITEGYLNIAGVGGFYPPGVASFAAVLASMDPLLTGHARAYDALHATDTTDASGDGTAAVVGLVQHMVAVDPFNPAVPGDVVSAANFDYLFNRVTLTALTSGAFDANLDGDTTDPGEQRSDLAGRTDYVGVNYYRRAVVISLGVPISPLIPLFDFLPILDYATPENPGGLPCPGECNDMGWEIFPQGLRRLLTFVGTLGVPVIITENGIADSADEKRAQFIFDHLSVLQEAIDDGVADVRGYLHWTLTDDFEWTSGYFPKFGLREFDSATAKERRRKGARPFKSIARHNGITSCLIRKFGSPSAAFLDATTGVLD